MDEKFEDTITQLNPEEEVQFDVWAGKMRSEGKIHPLDDFSDYDMRGYWKETGGNESLKAGEHFPDKWKRPNHPTFSTESVYSQGDFAEKYGDMAGHWENNEFVPPVSVEELYNTYENDAQTEYDTLRQKDILEEKFGVTLDYNPQGISKKTEEMANSKEMPPDFVDTMSDIAYSFFKGIHSFASSLQELGASAGAQVAEWQTGQKIDFDPSRDLANEGVNKIFMPEPTTKYGKITEGVTQVGLGIWAGKLLGIPGLAKTNYGNGLVNALASCFGMFSLETVAFSANEANFAEVLKAFGLPTIEALVKNPNDTFWQKKIKNGVSAGVAGLVIDGIYKTAKMFYNAGIRALRNKKVYQPLLEGPEIVDAEYRVVDDLMLGKPSNQLVKGAK